MKITKRELIKLIQEQIDYSGIDPRWNPDVVNVMDIEAKKKVASKNLDFTAGLFKLVKHPNMWSSENYGSEIAKEIKKIFGKYFQNGLVFNGINIRSNNNLVERLLNKDYKLIDIHETPKTKYDADHKYKLYKTKNNKYFVFTYSDKPEMAADGPYIYAGDAGGSNWSGHWRIPDL